MRAVGRLVASAATARYNGFLRAATLRRGHEPVRGNGTAERVAYITVNDRRIFFDAEARGSQRDIV
jgi:hypothetical protein